MEYGISQSKSGLSSENEIKVSIIVPVYNVENYLEKCLNSLVSQTLKDVEIICINDGSADRSLGILKKFSAKDRRIVLIDQKNQGVSRARNNGLAAAKGKYIAFVDSDDYVDERMCEETYALAQKTNADIVVFGGTVFTEFPTDDEYLNSAQRFFENNLNTKDAIYSNNSVIALCNENGSWPLIWNKLYKREVIRRTKGFNEELALGEDEEFLFSVFPVAEHIVYTRNKYYHYMRNRPSSATDLIVRNFEKRAESNLKMAQLVKDSWDKLGIIRTYEDEFLNRYIDLLFDSVNTVSYDPNFQKSYAQKVVMFFAENFPKFSSRMIENYYIKLQIYDKNRELEQLKAQIGSKQNEIYSLYNERDKVSAKVQAYEKVLDSLNGLSAYLQTGKKRRVPNRNKAEKVKKEKRKRSAFDHPIVSRIAGKSRFYKSIVDIYSMIYQNGFSAYERLKKQYGKDCVFISCAAAGIGDAYIVGSFINEWKLKHNVYHYMILLCGKPEIKMMESIFPDLAGHCVLITVQEHEWLRNFDRMCNEKTDFWFLHHFDYMQPQLQLTEKLQGYKNINMKDLYLWKMRLPIDTQYVAPPTDREKYADKINSIFKEHSLIKGKTVMIAPYSTCLGSLPDEFWSPITDELKSRGYTLCCNCAENQTELSGTVKMLLPFDMMIPFLEEAGAFIGFRSGLCDVISSARCKMIVVHSSQSDKWGDGTSLAYVGIKNMQLSDTVNEFVLYGDLSNSREIQKNILGAFSKGDNSKQKFDDSKPRKVKRSNERRK